MPDVEPLSTSEERAWRALARVMLTLPRLLDADLVAATGLSMPAYGVLMNLSEAPGRRLRMTELAGRNSLSPSRLTRIVDELVEAGLVCRERSADDGRGFVAILTPAGLRQLRRAYPAHLASVRARVIDNLDGLDLDQLADALTRVAERRARPRAAR